VRRRRYLIPIVALAALGLVLAGAFAGVLLAGGHTDSTVSTRAATGGKGYLGLTVTAETAGLRVATVAPGGPAADAGIAVGDILRSVDGKVVRTPEQLRAAAEAHKPGDSVTLTYERGDQEARAEVRLATEPTGAQIESTPAPDSMASSPAGLGRGRLGAQVAQITPALQQRLNLPRAVGVVVTDVAPGGPAANAGLQAGDVILAMGPTVIANTLDLQRALIAAPTDQALTLRIARGTDEMNVSIVLPAQSSLDGLEGALPPALRQYLQQAIDDGSLPPDQLQQLLRLYQARGENVRAGTVTVATADSLTITPSVGGDEVTTALTPATSVRRRGSPITAGDIQPGETVVILSRDGGATAFSVLDAGIVP
jgi:membrane-associated protease RseP (regulator of RpoE activity)